jgi:hypothetical protein
MFNSILQGSQQSRYVLVAVIAVVLAFAGITGCTDKKHAASLFRVLDSKATGLEFTNQLTPTASFNLFSYMYYYNGAGVGSGDFNNDGLIDLFFTANQKSNALYLNKGGMHFENVSAASGIPADSAWSTGVSVVDINSDGLLDIYICRVANFLHLKGSNQLLVCTGIDEKGIPHYKEQAADYGLNFSGFSTQAAFLDYDADGDLDLFLLNHPVTHDGNYAPRSYFDGKIDSLAGQRMYRNDRLANGQVHYTNVTINAGINGTKIGYGLGVAIADINLDGWPDIYVGNDFHENDYLYLNQRNGTFAEEGTRRMAHTSQFSMGVDVADVNNDARPDIISVDMLPYDPYMIRRSPSEDDYTIFQQKLAYGYAPQYARNNLQYNRENGQFSELGQYAGVHATDWSWAPLWVDFNNDGKKDLFVSNGIPKRMNDIDYINFISGKEIQQKLKEQKINDKDLALTNKFPEIKIPNQFFLNQGAFGFKNLTDSIAVNPTSFSNGALYADLDNDGDQDIVVNNINDPVMVYENNTNQPEKRTAYASVALKGFPVNTQALGAKLLVYTPTGIQTYEQQTVHGFQSSMQAALHVGLEGVQVDSALLIWPDSRYERLALTAGKKQTVAYRKDLPLFNYSSLQVSKATPVFEDITATTGLTYKHIENPFNEFDREPLIPHMVSAEGPALAVADINHDGLEDVFVGASKTHHGAVYLQTKAGKFVQLPQPELAKDSMWEQVDAQWADLNNDTYPDLVIASGGNEYYGEDPHLQPLLYLNDGTGRLLKKADAFGAVYVTQSRVAVHDFSGDGIPDLFIAGRVQPWQYGTTPRSYLLQNDGTGKFRDVTAAYSKDLLQPGMVSGAAWADLNGDGKKELVLSYEWGGIDAFFQQGNRFQRQPLTSRKGWWQFIEVQDVDGDGDADILAGNLGLNTRLKASEKEPVRLYINDFDNNGRTEQVMSYFLKGTELPFAGKGLLEKQIPLLRKKFLYAADFAKAGMAELFGQQQLNKSIQLQADYFANAQLKNNGKGQFELQALPYEAQLSTMRAASLLSGNGTSGADMLLMGNFYPYSMELGRQDADYGTLVRINNGRITASEIGGVAVAGEVRQIRPIRIGTRTVYLIAKNNAPIQVIAIR